MLWGTSLGARAQDATLGAEAHRSGSQPTSAGPLVADLGDLEHTRRAPETELADDADDEPGLVFARETASRSVGNSSRGRLRHSVSLRPAPHLRIKNEQTSHGTEELVRLIDWAATRVTRRHPGAQLLVGDLSRERGGRFRPHRSHRSGRDADIGFYLTDTEGNPVVARRFVRIGRNLSGSTPDGMEVRFDLARNWELVAALLGQDVVPVQYMMVVQRLKDALMNYGREHGASETLLARAEEALGPRSAGGRGDSHYSHFHVRIFCPIDDRETCRDRGPVWDWLGDDFRRPEGGENLRLYQPTPAERRRAERQRRARRQRAERRRARNRRRARAQRRRARAQRRRARARHTMRRSSMMSVASMN